MEEYLKRIYYDITNPNGFGGVGKLLRAAKEEGFEEASYGKVKKWLQSQENYSTNVSARHKVNRGHIPITALDFRWQCDLLSFESVKEKNDGHSFILVAMDEFSRYCFTRPLKRKTGPMVSEALESIFKIRRPLYSLRSDRRQEFRARQVGEVAKKYGIYQSFIYHESHGTMVERLNRTLKLKLWKYMQYKNTHRWLDALEAVTKSYNNSVHSSLGVAPSSVTPDNEDEIRLKQYLIREKKYGPKKAMVKKREGKPLGRVMKRKRKTKYKVGDLVRVSYLKNKFSRGYDQQYSSELFYVKKAYVRPGDNIDVYQLEDWYHKSIDGTFFNEELIATKAPEEFPIEKILKKEKRKGKWYYYVKFRNWDKKYSEWVEADAVRDLL